MQTTSFKEIIKALLILAVLGFFIASAIGWLINFTGSSVSQLLLSISTLDAAIVVALITGCISILSVVIGALANNRLAYLQRREEYLRTHREETYQQLIAIFMKVQSKARLENGYPQEEMIKDIFDFTESLMLWGSSKALKMWAEWRLSASKSLSPQTLLLNQEKIIIQLRKDMGQKGGLHEGDILKLFINDVDEAILNKQTN